MKLKTQVYDNEGTWLKEFDGKNLCLPYRNREGEAYNTPVARLEDAEDLARLGYIPEGREVQKTAGFKKRPSQ